MNLFIVLLLVVNISVTLARPQFGSAWSELQQDSSWMPSTNPGGSGSGGYVAPTTTTTTTTTRAPATRPPKRRPSNDSPPPGGDGPDGSSAPTDPSTGPSKGFKHKKTKEQATTTTQKPVENPAMFLPPKSFAPLNPVTESIWQFEDIDYDNVEHVGEYDSKEYSDCFGIYIQCLTNVHHTTLFCAVNFRTGRVLIFYTQCEMDYQRCFYRKKFGQPHFGRDYRDEYLEWYKEGNDCAQAG